MARGKESTEFLKECMSDALIKLMEDRSIEKIAIKQITRLAGVGRSTWFRHFSAKEDALTYKLTALWKRWEEERGFSENQLVARLDPHEFFLFNYENRALLKKLCDAELQGCIYDAFCLVVMNLSDTTPLEYYRSRFYAYGVFGLLGEWIKRDFRESPDEMVELFRQIMTDGLSPKNALGDKDTNRPTVSGS